MTWRVNLIKLQKNTGFIEPLQQRQRFSIQLFLQGLCMHSKVHVKCQLSTGSREESSTSWLWMTERTMSNAIKSYNGGKSVLHTKIGSDISVALILWEILRFQKAWTICYWVLWFFIYVVGEIVQELRALSGLPEDQGLILRIHMVVLNHLYYNCRESTTLWWPLQITVIHVAHSHTCRQNTYIHKIKF